MHPILARRDRIAIYFGAAIVLSLIPAAATVFAGGAPFVNAILASIPPTLVFALLGLLAWFPCRALPVGETSRTRLLSTHLVGALIAAALWMLLWHGWSVAVPERFLPGGWVIALPPQEVLLAAGFLFYLLSVAVHYLLAAFERSRAAEQASMEYKVLAREAELRAFKAQIDPHFLFNSLNSISSLCGSNPAAARQMTQQLADFFRRSLRLGARPRISLGEEIDLTTLYLGIEQVRFGDRLGVDIDIEAGVRDTLVPPLILQPLAENAVRHGVAGLVDGGSIRVSARLERGIVSIEVENDCDEDRETTRGESIGLANVRGRLRTIYDSQASMEVRDSGTTFRVRIMVPPQRERTEP